MDILKQAAEAWQEISQNTYKITYGLKKKLHYVNIIFDNSDFCHLAGFQYLKDIQLPALSPAKLFNAVLNDEITAEQIQKAEKYETMVETRLVALINLEEALDNDIKLFRYNSKNYSFYTAIEAQYLIEGQAQNNNMFLFVKKNDNYFTCLSIFIKDQSRDYSQNQQKLSILHIEKINLVTNEKTILFDKLSKQENYIPS